MDKTLKEMLTSTLEAEPEKLKKVMSALEQEDESKVEELCDEVKSLIEHECEAMLENDALYFFDLDSEELAKTIVITILANGIYDIGKASLKATLHKIFSNANFEVDDEDSLISKILAKANKLFNK